MLRSARCFAIGASIVGIFHSVPVSGQSGQVIMMRDDGEAAPTVMHFSMPDFIELRQPDFLKRDLPTFKERLILSDEQFTVVERMIEEYLESFKKLAMEHLPKGAGGPMRIDLGDGDDGRPLGLMMVGPGDELNEDELEMLEGGIPAERLPRRLGIDVRVGGPGPDGAEDDQMPEGGVAFSLEMPEGEELSPEMKKRLEEAAAKIAEQMKERLDQQLAEGGDPQDVMPFGGPISIEDLQRRQEEMAAKAETFRVAKANLRQSFVAQVQTTLATPQVERWPDLERALRREKTLPKGRLSGERTDLVKVFKGIEPSETDRESVSEQMLEYELALDHALQQRNQFLPGAESKISQAMQAGDTDKALSIIDRAAALRIAVRSVNEQFTDAIAQQLPADKAERFREAFLKTSFPRVYRTTYVQRMFDAVRKLETLEAKAKSELAELEKAYATDLAAMNTQLRQVTSKHEPAEPRHGIEQMQKVVAREIEPGSLRDEREEDPIAKAFERRHELDDRYASLMLSLLTPEQIAQLPKAPSRKTSEPVIIRVPMTEDRVQ